MLTSIARVNTEQVAVHSVVDAKRPDGTLKSDAELAAEHFHQIIKLTVLNLEVIPAEV